MGSALGVMLFVFLFPSHRSCTAYVLGSVNRDTQLPLGAESKDLISFPMLGFHTQN